MGPRSNVDDLERDKSLSPAKKRTRFLGRSDRSLISTKGRRIQ